MKKIFCLTVLLFSAIAVFAQEKPIDQSEFDAVMATSYGKYRGFAYKQTITVEHTSESLAGVNRFTSRTIRETSPEMKMRWVLEFDSPPLKRITETISVNGRLYRRIDDGVWEIVNREPSQQRDSGVKLIEGQTEYKALGTEKLDNRNTLVFAQFQKKKYLNQYNQNESLSTTTTKNWIGEDGKIQKQEVLTETRVKPVNGGTESVYRESRVTVWELDPTIKIDAPIAAKP